ncbi:MAG: divalent metal cation transporter [Peptococcaceae bacterium]|nr:divalent metal cation transporter [Peptococcaceae bacterium]
MNYPKTATNARGVLEPAVKKSSWSVLLGAAFIMATSAIGPGFLTQTAVFTEKLAASFGFAILLSIVLDIGAQLNMWRIITMSGMRGQDIANAVLPGLGYFVSFAVVLGGLAFNIGNIAGCGLGMNVLFGLTPQVGALISALIAVFIFLSKEMGKAMDGFAKVLGLVMIVITAYIAVITHPPVGQAVVKSIAPDKIDMFAVLTLVGGTVGGYITFAGGHRLLDAGMKGQEYLKEVSKASVSGILITAVMRIILFLAVLGVVAAGASLDPSNPPASVFKIAAGNAGFKFFGIVIWCAAITSVVGAAYTSVSFLRSFHPVIEKKQPLFIIGFICFSTLVFVLVGKPVKVLIAAGALNGLILPVALVSILLAVRSRKIIGDYKHPLWMTVFGACVAATTAIMGGKTFITELPKLFK